MAVSSSEVLTNPVIKVAVNRPLRCCWGQSLGKEYVSRAVARKTCRWWLEPVISRIIPQMAAKLITDVPLVYNVVHPIENCCSP